MPRRTLPFFQKNKEKNSEINLYLLISYISLRQNEECEGGKNHNKIILKNENDEMLYTTSKK